ncbi:Ig-like domain-containing protein [Paenibacillus sp. D2_2]|uniref:Ig-like domain-containing protein n=1 Tax=Paenibacillus sp. D2_2 TaxID=3073092 RepID=UPI002816000B|nr:Ig-like domain-containing protein [Paenibacillus sp. D2_2]WMT40682.1 Ig-like domain-containing protein [Paenibacillus sp. D2_2]
MRRKLSVALAIILVLNTLLGVIVSAAEETSFKVAVTPTNGDKGVAVGIKAIQLTFDRNVREGNGTITVFKVNGDKSEEELVSKEITPQGYVIRGMEIALPGGSLDYNTTYHVVGKEGAFVDAAKEAVKSEAIDLTFTTLSNAGAKHQYLLTPHPFRR